MKKKNKIDTPEKPLVLVEWEDASHNSIWQKEDSIEREINEPVIICDVGWLVKENKKTVLMSSRYSPTGDDYNFVRRIPRSLVRKMEVIGKSWPVNGETKNHRRRT